MSRDPIDVLREQGEQAKRTLPDAPVIHVLQGTKLGITCLFCGKEYDLDKSGALMPGNYCSEECEREAEADSDAERAQ